MLVCSSGSVSACLNVVGPLSVAVVINQNLEHGGLQNLLNREVLLGAVLKTVNYHHSNGHGTFHKEESFHANS